MIHGLFIEEQKTRFLCNVLIDGKLTECYMPSSCKLGKIVELSGKEALLKPVKKKNARTALAVQAIKLEDQFIWINLADVNRTVEKQLQNNVFSFLGKRDSIKRESNFGNYKADLFIEDSKTIIEVKTVLSSDKVGIYPTDSSKRAERQLEYILELLDTNNVCYIIVALNPKTQMITINNNLRHYHELFKKCLGKGMICKGLSVKVNVDNEPVIYHNIEVIIN